LVLADRAPVFSITKTRPSRFDGRGKKSNAAKKVRFSCQKLGDGFLNPGQVKSFRYNNQNSSPKMNWATRQEEGYVK